MNNTNLCKFERFSFFDGAKHPVLESFTFFVGCVLTVKKNFPFASRKKKIKSVHNKERKTNFKFLVLVHTQKKGLIYALCKVEIAFSPSASFSFNFLFVSLAAKFSILCAAGFIHFIIRPRNHWSIHFNVLYEKWNKASQKSVYNNIKRSIKKKRDERTKWMQKKLNNYYVYAMYASLFFFIRFALRKLHDVFSAHCFCGCY